MLGHEWTATSLLTFDSDFSYARNLFFFSLLVVAVVFAFTHAVLGLYLADHAEMGGGIAIIAIIARMHDKAKNEPTHLQDVIIEKQLHEVRDTFIQSIRPDDVRQLTASYHSSQHPSEFFQERIRGSYIICYFVRFPSSVSGQWDKWDRSYPLDAVSAIRCG